ncbi:MAG TPA: hypothetical protein VH255_05500, partial [Verrucomicrobiae bacterium]|nr:hypothetical protein [Verrucomicrobiae bacterium]
MTDEVIGKPIDRVDGWLKVTGQARYAGDFLSNNSAYAVTVQSTISKGSIATMDISSTATAPGVIAV